MWWYVASTLLATVTVWKMPFYRSEQPPALSAINQTELQLNTAKRRETKCNLTCVETNNHHESLVYYTYQMTYLNRAASLTQFWKQWFEHRGYSWGQESGEVCGLAFNSLCDLGWITPLLSLCELWLMAPSPIMSWSEKGSEVNPCKTH